MNTSSPNTHSPSHKIESKSNSYEITCQKTVFTIMQLTDLHYHHLGWTDKREMREIRDWCLSQNVDLVIITGDLFGHRDIKTIKKITNAFEKIVGSVVPWTFAWGNHDSEIYDNYPKGDFFSIFDAVEKHLESLPNCLYRQSRQFIEQYGATNIEDSPSEQEAYTIPLTNSDKAKTFDGFYGGNFKITLKTASLNSKPMWDLFLLNSRIAHSVPPKALYWMRDEIEHRSSKIPALAFYHVPNKEYIELWEKNLAYGIKREKVCSEKDPGFLHQIFKDVGVVRGAFVGHDHVNDYGGEIDGIYYSYGRKTGRNGYGGKKIHKMPALKPGTKAIELGSKIIKLSLENPEPLQNSWENYSLLHDGSIFKPKTQISW